MAAVREDVPVEQMSDEEIAFADALYDAVDAHQDEVDWRAMLVILVTAARTVAAANDGTHQDFTDFLNFEIEGNELAFAMIEADSQEGKAN